MPAFLLTKPALYAAGVLAVLSLLGFQQYRILNCQSKNTQLQAEYQQERADRAEAARTALEAAVAAERAKAEARVVREQEAASRLREAAREASRAAGEWRQRYEQAKADDPGCREWSEQPVLCPL